MTTFFQLHAPRLSAAKPIEAEDGLPPEVAGQPAAYFWKELIHAGNYVHPTRGFSLKVDAPRLRQWADTGSKMLSAGVPVPINCDHSDRARDVIGYVKQFKLEDDGLLGLCQFIGSDAALMAARNRVSIGINPKFTDGEARQWGEAIVHVALTPVPVVPGQGEFVVASFNGDSEETLVLAVDSEDVDQTVFCSVEQLALLRQLIPDGADLSADDCIERVITCIQSLQQDESDLDAQLTAANGKVVELSDRIPAELGAEAERAVAMAATAKFELAVERGGISPASRDRLLAALLSSGDGKKNLLMLSHSADSAGERLLAITIADILAENRPIELGEKTGLQTLSRLPPGEESGSIDELRQYMTKVASVNR